MAIGTLQDIETKVRRLTRSPSTAQLSQADLDTYINTFVLYDFPEQLRTFNLRQTFSFWAQPFQDSYPINVLGYGGASNASGNPLYDFENNYLTIHPPVYIGGYQSFYSQSREQFYGIYPLVNSIAQAAVGDGVTDSFTGFINANQSVVPNNLQQQVCLLRNNVLFSSVDINLNGLAMVDIPVLDDVTGNPTPFGNLYPQNNLPLNLYPTTAAPYSPGVGSILVNNYINYVTGQFVVTFPTAPLTGELINSQSIPQIVTIPQAMLFYDGNIVLRPVPDQPYQVNFEVYKKPTQLLSSLQMPDLNEWWQYIAYGAAKKIFEDRMDMDSVQLIMPEFKTQERLCLRRTLVQYTNERTGTIYTDQTDYTGQGGWGWGGGSGGNG